jgi:hypothetical protein
MPPKKDKKKKVKKPAKKSAVSQSQNITVNISKGTRVPKKASVVQNMPIRTPSIFNPAPTTFQISAPQPKPYSSAKEIAEEVTRLVRTDYERAVQQPNIMRLPSSELPTGSSVVEPQFNNMEVPTSFTQLETPPARKKQITPKQRAQDRARMMGLSTIGTTSEILQRIGRFEREEEIVGMAQGTRQGFLGMSVGSRRQVPKVSEE